MEEDGEADPTIRQLWKIGAANGIRAADLVLLNLEHVSKGSWQVQLQLLHPRVLQGHGHQHDASDGCSPALGVAYDGEPYRHHAFRED